MGEHEAIENYFRRVEASIDSLTESATRAGHDDKIPNQESQALHFIDRLSPAYGEYRHCVIKGILNRPVTLDEAYRAAVNFGTSRAMHFGTAPVRDHRGVFATVTQRHGKGRDRGRQSGSGPGRGKYPTLNRDQCAICKQVGHWKKDCPNKNEDQKIDEAIADATSKPTPNGAGGGGKNKKN